MWMSVKNVAMVTFRAAERTDAEGMAQVQNAIYRAGLRADPVDEQAILKRYLGIEHTVACTVAVKGGRILGFQSLKRAWHGNPYGAPEGWGIIGTHIDPSAGRTGIGRRLFDISLAAVKAADLRHIDATIGADNDAALAYYSAMGFVPYKQGNGAIPHRLDL